MMTVQFYLEPIDLPKFIAGELVVAVCCPEDYDSFSGFLITADVDKVVFKHEKFMAFVCKKTRVIKPKDTQEDNAKIKYLEFVYLTLEENKKLIEDYGSDATSQMIERLNDYIGQIGMRAAAKKYKSHYHVILNWHRRDAKLLKKVEEIDLV